MCNGVRNICSKLIKGFPLPGRFGTQTSEKEEFELTSTNFYKKKKIDFYASKNKIQTIEKESLYKQDIVVYLK